MVGKLLLLLASYLGGILGGVALHEFGHAATALLATRQRVIMEVGSAGRRWSLNLGRLALALRSRGLRYGSTRYERGRETRRTQALVAAGGPLASLIGCLGFGGWLLASETGSWQWVVALGFAAANFRILIVAVWPIEYRSGGEGTEVWTSDGLDLWRLLKSKRP